MSNWVRMLAGVATVAAVALLAYALLTPQDSGSTDHSGMMGHMNYDAGDVGLIVLSVSIMAISIMILLLWKDYEPVPPSMAPPSTTPLAGNAQLMAEEGVPSKEPQVAEERPESETAAREYLILRLLTGDERIMFKAIMDSGGEALQKDLIVTTKMSNAKVSRILDRLGQKGVVTKERHGSTNKIRIKLE